MCQPQCLRSARMNARQISPKSSPDIKAEIRPGPDPAIRVVASMMVAERPLLKHDYHTTTPAHPEPVEGSSFAGSLLQTNSAAVRQAHEERVLREI